MMEEEALFQIPSFPFTIFPCHCSQLPPVSQLLVTKLPNFLTFHLSLFPFY
jgi:hypothetical protein